MNKKRIISLIMGCMLIGSIGMNVLADENNNSIESKISEQKITVGGCIDLRSLVEYRVLEKEEIQNDSEIQKWIEENRGSKGTYLLDTEKEYNYIMISLGRLGGGGHEIVVQDMGIFNNTLNIIYKHYQSEKGKMMRNMSFPYIIVELPKNEKFDEIKSVEREEFPITIGGGKFYNEMTGEYNIEGRINGINKEENIYFVGIDRNGAPMKVRIDEKILSEEDKAALKVGARVTIIAKEEMNDEKVNEMVAQKVIFEEVDMENQFKDYEIINRYELKDKEIIDFIEKNKREKGFYKIKKDGYTYVMVFGGTRNTGGYNLEIQSVVLKDGNLDIMYKMNEPGPGQMVTMAITYPMQIMRISDKHEVNNVEAIQSTVCFEDAKDMKDSKGEELDKSMTLDEIGKEIKNSKPDEKLNIVQKLMRWISDLLK